MYVLALAYARSHYRRLDNVTISLKQNAGIRGAGTSQMHHNLFWSHGAEFLLLIEA